MENNFEGKEDKQQDLSKFRCKDAKGIGKKDANVIMLSERKKMHYQSLFMSVI